MGLASNNKNDLSRKTSLSPQTDPEVVHPMYPAFLRLSFLLFFLVLPESVPAYWEFPPLPPPHEYGNILINRTSEANGVKPAFFSHWSHRQKYACRVCHLELGFSFAVNETGITEEDNRKGRYCGACHNGKEVFGHTRENCDKCHTGSLSSGQKRFSELLDTMPRTPFGNRIDWVTAVKEGMIEARYSRMEENQKPPVDFRERLELYAEWTYVPPAYFPHAVHSRILDCGSCHPDIFRLKKKTTRHFKMEYILEKRFCGVCHLNVAFPLNDCKRCHPGMENP